MAKARKRIGWQEKAKGLFLGLLLLGFLGWFLFIFGSLAWQGGAAWLDWRAFEQRSVPTTGTVIGRALYDVLLPALKAKGSHAAFAGIAMPNPGSVALHETHGFAPIGIYREVGWKLNGWRDVGWWQRSL